MNDKRVRLLNDAAVKAGPIVYWMSRDQRVADNWALLYAQELALQNRRPLAVIFCLVPSFLNATERQYGFMLAGLQQVEERLQTENIPFYLLTGSPEQQIPAFVKKHTVGALVTDFDPLRIKRNWKEAVGKQTDIPVYEVDTHNIVPCWIASPKQEFAAHTFRPKVQRVLGEFLEEFPKLTRHPFSWKGQRSKIGWHKVMDTLAVDHSVSEINWIAPGEMAAHQALSHFLENKLASYSRARNDPTKDGQSHLSPYLHFGHISAQRVAFEVQQLTASGTSHQEFLEELIVRRELSDNFCFYNRNYDKFEGFPAWAQETLKHHENDRRQFTYSLKQLEYAETHDELWNAAQMQMVKAGKMHGYMRMYWAKKILEWTDKPQEALHIALYLNDRYELDGRNPNGYAGCAWSIGGVHDRAWFERPVFGKIRYMSYKGCKAKFDVASYIRTINDL